VWDVCSAIYIVLQEFFMKKLIVAATLIFCAVSVFSQRGDGGQGERRGPKNLEPVTVSGTMVLSEGRIAVKSGEDVYYTPGLARLVGFVDGLKENAAVKLEGYDFAAGWNGVVRHVLRATKLEIGGRSYDLGNSGFPGGGQERGYRLRRGQDFGPCCGSGRGDFGGRAKQFR
jgi:hypothetical protein